MNAMDQFIEQKVCQEIDCLTMQLLNVFDDNQDKAASYGNEQQRRIIQNAIFNMLISVYQPATKSPSTTQNYPRYAEQIRDDFNKMILFLADFKPQKLYR